MFFSTILLPLINNIFFIIRNYFSKKDYRNGGLEFRDFYFLMLFKSMFYFKKY